MTMILIRSVVATLIAFTGAAVGVTLDKFASRRLHHLVFAAMGVLLAVTVFDVLPDAKASLSWPIFLVAVVSGYLLFWLVGKYVYHVCPACSVSAIDRTKEKLRQTVILLMVALSIHSTMDGVAVAVGDRIVGHANLGVLLGVSFHKFPEGMALALLLLGAGYSRPAAFWTATAIESTTEFGALMGVLVLQHASRTVLGLLFANVGGGFVYLVVTTCSSIFERGDGSGPRNERLQPALFAGGASFVITAGMLWILRSAYG